MDGYIKVPELSKNGKQHLHVLFRGSYIEQQMVSQLWQEIHHAKIVDIRKAGYSRGNKGIAADMASYMAKANLYRYSWNWAWVWRGFVKDWVRLKRLFRQVKGEVNSQNIGHLLKLWRLWLKDFWKPDFSLLVDT